jgi:hypothetical protein
VEKRKLIQSLTFGSDVAEHEIQELSKYFVETDQWAKLFEGRVDVVYGPKGSGKSAIYYLLLDKENDLFEREVLLATAENPRSDPAFAEIKADFPPSEEEFVGLWKLYLCSVAALRARDKGIHNENLSDVLILLADLGLIERELSLNTIIKAVSEYASRLFRPKSIEGAISLDPLSGLPNGFSTKISFGEPSTEARRNGVRPVRELLQKVDAAYQQSGFTVWLLLDRLDVAFAANSEVETRALRALFKTYNDMAALGNVKLKIFMRSDIWDRITEGGFREATHAASPHRSEFLKWDINLLFNVLMKRLLGNKALCEHYGVDPDKTVGSLALQEELFDRIFPDKIDTGNNPKTFGWIYGRLRDGQGQVTPRELIQFMSSLRDVQLKKLERGVAEPSGDLLFERPSFKEALPSVSEIRLQRTIYAEYPQHKANIESLRSRKSRQSIETLARLWNETARDAEIIALKLHKIGVLEKFEWKGFALYRVPFLYRPALQIVQGSEEGIAADVAGDDDD